MNRAPAERVTWVGSFQRGRAVHADVVAVDRQPELIRHVQRRLTSGDHGADGLVDACEVELGEGQGGALEGGGGSGEACRSRQVFVSGELADPGAAAHGRNEESGDRLPETQTLNRKRGPRG